MKERKSSDDCATGYAGRAAQAAALAGGWSAARYHGDTGDSVAKALSFNSVFEINPFEVGASHAAERRLYARLKPRVIEALGIAPLLKRPFAALSNGEMRRTLLAREILSGPKRLAVSDPYGGLDADWRQRVENAARQMKELGVEITLEDTPANVRGGAPGAGPRKRPAETGGARAVLEMSGVNVAFGRRVLFKDFSWTVREGERWLLTGPNGSGKTTLIALATGDSPLGYAFDISLFGKKRGESGAPLEAQRRKLAVVSAEKELYTGVSIEAQLDAALSEKTRLLILDEPCCDMPAAEARKTLARVAAWLDKHPKAAAICVAHAKSHIPAGFDRALALPQKPGD